LAVTVRLAAGVSISATVKAMAPVFESSLIVRSVTSLVVAGLKTNTRNRVTVIRTTDDDARTTLSDFLIQGTTGLRVFTPPQDALLMPGSDVRIYFDAEYVERVTEITLPVSPAGTDAALEKAQQLLR
jgi:hypothetical protein